MGEVQSGTIENKWYKNLIDLENPLFWILILFIIRLFHLNIDPLGAPGWRQAITLGVARNYLEWDWNFFHPRTVLCDSRSGIFPQEFPILNYIIAIGWKVFGQENWVYRVILLIANSLGLWWFYGIINKTFNKRAALIAMVLFGSSIAFIYSRKATPDVFSVSLVLGGVYYGWKYLETHKFKDLLFCFLLVTLGALSKIPASVVAAFLIIPFLDKSINLKFKLAISCSLLLTILCIGMWYFVWVPWAENTYGFRLFYPKSLSEGFYEITTYGYNTWERFESLAFQNRITFYICIIGLITMIFTKRNLKVLLVVLCYCLVFFFFMVKAGFVFSSHEYYVIAFIPLMAMLGGFGLDYWLPKRKWIAPLIIVVLASISIYPQLHRFKINESDLKYTRLEELCNKYIPKDAKILTSDHDGSTKMMYFCHRLGWSDDERWKDEKWLAGEATVGMAYVVVERFRHDKYLSIPLIYEDKDFLIYKTIPRK